MGVLIFGIENQEPNGPSLLEILEKPRYFKQ